MPLSSACLLALAHAAQTPMTVAAVPAEQLAGRGAEVPFFEYEAENGCFSGTLTGPSRALSDIAAEASGRRAVRLERAGDYIEVTLARDANAVTVRYAIPDSADGSGLDSTLGVEVGGTRLGSLMLTSRYSWYYGRYPFTNRPADGRPRHYFDEARLKFSRTLARGTRVRLVADQGAAWTVIDLADFELVPAPRARPAGAVAIVDFGADPTGRRTSYHALRAAIRAARRRRLSVWLGEGIFRIDRHVEVDRVAIAGAGPWYSVLRGHGVGLYGRKPPHGSTAVSLSDFSIIGDVRERADHKQLAGIGGSIGGGSQIRDLWLQHHKVGIWLDGPLDGLVISKLRITDQAADGINLRGGASNARIEHSFVRNSGDDGIALWSQHFANHRISVRNNTIIAPNLANGIAVYGGHDIAIGGNVVADTLNEGGGIHLGNRFKAVPLSGAITLSDNLLVRSGSFDPNWGFGVGALWFYALDHPIDAKISISSTDIVDSTITAIQFIGKPISHAAFDRLTIRGAHHWLQVQSGGAAIFSRLIATGLTTSPYLDCDPAFRATFDASSAITRPDDQLCGKLDPGLVADRLAH